MILLCKTNPIAATQHQCFLTASRFGIGTNKSTTMGLRHRLSLYRRFAVLVRTRHWLIIYVAVQPPNNKVLRITLALLVLTAIIWYLFEKQALRGRIDRRNNQDDRDPGGRAPSARFGAGQHCVSRPRGCKPRAGAILIKGGIGMPGMLTLKELQHAVSAGEI